VVRRYRKVLVPELNTGQFARVLRAAYLVDARTYSKVQGLPFTARELEHAIDEISQELAS
jgi:2-oxoglutarate/2-oxoacid ferredoxin oxidoreductase subunit alpha